MSPPLTVRTTITASSIGADLDRILKEEDVAATTPPDIDGLMVFPGILDSDVTRECSFIDNYTTRAISDILTGP